MLIPIALGVGWSHFSHRFGSFSHKMVYLL